MKFSPLKSLNLKTLNSYLAYLFKQASFSYGMRIRGTYLDNAGAVASGLTVGDYYQTFTGEIRIVV